MILWDPTEKNQNDEFTCIRFYRPLNIVWLSGDGQLWLKLVAVSNNITRTVKRCVTEFINLSIVRCSRRALVSGVRYWHSIFCSEDGSSVFFVEMSTWQQAAHHVSEYSTVNWVTVLLLMSDQNSDLGTDELRSRRAWGSSNYLSVTAYCAHQFVFLLPELRNDLLCSVTSYPAQISTLLLLKFWLFSPHCDSALLP